MMLPDTREGPVRPVIRTFYDHLQVRCLFGALQLFFIDRHRLFRWIAEFVYGITDFILNGNIATRDEKLMLLCY